MRLKIFSNYSPSFDPIKRQKTQIKFLIFHYTGMKKESDAIKKLTNFRSNVSCHYFIKQNGETLKMVPDLYLAWHAGKSQWKKYKSLNKYSIGIEISNPGHDYGYKKFSPTQINSLEKLLKYLVKKYNIKKHYILGHSDIAPDRKKDPGEKFPWKFLAKKNITVWHNLKNKDLKQNRRKKISNVNVKRFQKNLKKIGYFFQNSPDSKSMKKVIIAFQRHFRPELINGRPDQECLNISQAISNKI